MTLSALEPLDTTLHAPAVEVAYGALTLEAAHQAYAGRVLLCPHCLDEWVKRQWNIEIAETRLGQTPLYTAAAWEQVGLAERLGLPERLAAGVGAFPADLRVRFRRSSVNDQQAVTKWMHFCHVVSGSGAAQRPCHDPECLSRAVATGSIKLSLEQSYRSEADVSVQQTRQFGSLDASPARQPDLWVQRRGETVRVLEVLRQVLPKRDLVARTQHLQTLCTQVEWCFFKSAYDRMGSQRQWLTEQALTYYVMVWDGYKLRLSVGSPPVRPSVQPSEPTTRDGTDTGCLYRDPLDVLTTAPQVAPVSLLPTVVGAAVFTPAPSVVSVPSVVPPPTPVSGSVSQSVSASVSGPSASAVTETPPSVTPSLRPTVLPVVPAPASPLPFQRPPQLPQWGCSVGDRVEVYAEGKWRSGVVKSYNVEHAPFVQLDRPAGRHHTWTPAQPQLLRLIERS